MSVALAIYVVLVSVPLGLVAYCVDRASTLGGLPRRWVWAASLFLLVGLMVSAPWRPSLPPLRAADFKSASVVEAARPPSNVVEAASPIPALTEDLRHFADRVAHGTAAFDQLFVNTWLTASAAMVAIFLIGRLALATQRRTWRRAVVDNEHVLLSPALGPAVIGLISPRIVLPKWVLAMEPQAVNLIMRHERQHVAAADPWLVHLAGISIVACPWNPVVWWMASRLRLAVEFDCDARVLRAGDPIPPPEPLAYGDLLLEVAARRSGHALFWAPALVESSSRLARRLMAICPDAVRFARTKAVAATGIAALAATLAIIVPLPNTPLLVQAATAIGLEPKPATATTPASPTSDIAVRRREIAPVRMAPASARPSSPAATLPAHDFEAGSRTSLQPPSLEVPWNEPLARERTAAVPVAVAATQPPPAPQPFALDTPGLVAPVPTSTVRPRYTSAAMEERISGRVLVEVTVAPDGTVSNATVVRSLDAGLDRNALEAARQWRFRPATVDGRPVSVSIVLELAYQLH